MLQEGSIQIHDIRFDREHRYRYATHGEHSADDNLHRVLLLETNVLQMWGQISLTPLFPARVTNLLLDCCLAGCMSCWPAGVLAGVLAGVCATG